MAGLSQEIKEKIEGAMTLIYECGEDRDDVMDNLNAQISHLLRDEDVAEYYEYRDTCESRYEAQANSNPTQSMRMTSQSFHSTDPTHPLMPSIARIRITTTDDWGDDCVEHYVLAYHAERDLPALMTAGRQRLNHHDIVTRLIRHDYTSELGNGLTAFSAELHSRFNELRAHAKSEPNHNPVECETCKGKGQAYKLCEFTGDFIMADCDDCRAQRTN